MLKFKLNPAYKPKDKSQKDKSIKCNKCNNGPDAVVKCYQK